MAKLSKFQKEINDRELNSQIRFNMEMEGRNLFQSEIKRRHAMSSGGKKIAALAVIMVVLYFLSMTVVPGDALGLKLGVGLQIPWSLPIWRIQVMEKFKDLLAMNSGARTMLAGYACIFLAGMAMASAGCTYQGVFQNPMASPTTLGVYAGGTLGGMAYILFFWDTTFYAEHLIKTGDGAWVFSATTEEMMRQYTDMSVWQRCGLNIGIFAGCFAGVALIVGISLLVGKGKLSTVALMLAGSIFSTVINQLGQTLQYIILTNNPVEFEDARVAELAKLLGGISSGIGNSIALDYFVISAVPITLCLVILFSMGGKLNILMFGAEEAEAMGVPVRRFRNILIACCTVLSALIMCFYGQVGMLGFLMPHLARFLVGPDFKLLLPASALMGGICCLLTWDMCYVLGDLYSFNNYTGAVCSVLSILFILLYRRKRHADWS